MKLTRIEQIEVEAARQLNPEQRVMVFRQSCGTLAITLFPIKVAGSDIRKMLETKSIVGHILCPAFGGGNTRIVA